MLLIQLSQSYSINMVGHTDFGAQQKVPDLSAFQHSGEGYHFPGCIPPSDMVDLQSFVGIKPGGFGVVIRYQVDKFTHTWSMECFLAQSDIYPGFMSKVSALIHFPLKTGCEDYSFLYLAVEDFEHGLYSILMDSIDVPELDASFDEADAVLSSVSSGYVCLVSTISDVSRLQLARSFKSHILWYQARALLALQGNSSNCLVLIPHKQLGKYVHM